MLGPTLKPYWLMKTLQAPPFSVHAWMRIRVEMAPPLVVACPSCDAKFATNRGLASHKTMRHMD